MPSFRKNVEWQLVESVSVRREIDLGETHVEFRLLGKGVLTICGKELTAVWLERGKEEPEREAL